MTHLLKITVILIAGVLLNGVLLGCMRAPDTPPLMPPEMTYFKDQYGICYARLASLTYSGYFTISITTVPCEKVGL